MISLIVSHPRVDEGVRDVSEEVAENHERSPDKQERTCYVEISLVEGIEKQEAQTRPGKNRLGDYGPAEDEPYAEGHERHGVWEWRTSRLSNGLRRYVILTASNLEDESKWCDIQLYAAADDDRAFTKRLVARSLVSRYGTSEFIDKHGPAAFQAAERLTEDDLDNLYNHRRYSSPDEASSPIT